MGLAVHVKWGELQRGEPVSNEPSGRPAEVTVLIPHPPHTRCSLWIPSPSRGVWPCCDFSSVPPPCHSQQQRGTSQGNSTPEFKRNNRIGFDLFNSEIKVTRKYCGSYLCGLRGIFFFLATSFFSFDGPVIPRTVYVTDPACIQSRY